MQSERTKNASRNMAAGYLLRIYQLIFPFIIRTILINYLGMEYVGLNALFTSILQILNLAELGVGSAMVFSMYKPIAKENQDELRALMKLYRMYYRVIGVIIVIAGIALTPFVPQLIRGDVPAGINIYVLYLMNLALTGLSYWLFAYKNCLLTAYQRDDIISKITMSVSTLRYFSEAIIIIIFRNYYYYIIVTLIFQALINIVTAIVVDKMYPQLKPKGNLSSEKVKIINQRVKDLFTSKIGEIIVNSSDTIIISVFLGLFTLAVYNNYFYIYTAVFGFVAMLYQACKAGIGNSLITENEEKNINDLYKLTFLSAWIGGFCTCCLLCLYQPFMRIWLGEYNLMPLSCVICLCIYFYVRQANQLLIVYKDAAGVWHEDRFRPLCTALTNLILNLILVQFIGLYGILLSTVISTLLVGLPWLIKNLFTVLFKRSMIPFVKKIIGYAIVTFFTCVFTYLICSLIQGSDIIILIIRLLICFIIPNSIFWLVYHNMSEYKSLLCMVYRIVGRNDLKSFDKH